MRGKLYFFHMSENLQVLFLREIKDRLPPGASFVDEVADLLSVSTDSAYRRIRGETALTFEEAKKLSNKFAISIDALFADTEGNVSFKFEAIDPGSYDFISWLNSVNGFVKQLKPYSKKEMIYMTGDLTVFQILQVPEIASFKLFFWMKTLFNFPKLKGQKFELKELEADIYSLRAQILNAYNDIPSTVVLSSGMFASTIQQIKYYHESGLFAGSDTAMRLAEGLEELNNHMAQQAEHGTKFMYGNEPETGDDNYKLYYSEVLTTDEAVLLKTDDKGATIVTTNALNILYSPNQVFHDYTTGYIDNIIQSSTLISKVSAKERNKFFLSQQRQIDKLKLAVS